MSLIGFYNQKEKKLDDYERFYTSALNYSMCVADEDMKEGECTQKLDDFADLLTRMYNAYYKE